MEISRYATGGRSLALVLRNPGTCPQKPDSRYRWNHWTTGLRQCEPDEQRSVEEAKLPSHAKGNFAIYWRVMITVSIPVQVGSGEVPDLHVRHKNPL